MWRIPIRHAPSTKLQHRITNRQCLQWWGGGKPVQISRAWRWGPDYVVYVLTSHDNIIIYLLYKLTFFGPSSGHSATESRSFRFSVKIFSLFALYGGPEFPPPREGVPKSALGGSVNIRGKLQEKLLTLFFMFMTPCSLQVGTSVPEKQTAAFFVHRRENFGSSENVSRI